MTVWLGTYHRIYGASGIDGTGYIEGAVDPNGKTVSHDLQTVCDLEDKNGSFVENGHDVDYLGGNIKEYCSDLTQVIDGTSYNAIINDSSVLCYDKDPNPELERVAIAMQGDQQPYFCSEVWECASAQQRCFPYARKYEAEVLVPDHYAGS
eukprot:TRINITY_DN5340_c0_g1_i9.p3 TRINITY_DN5340_c0_g1~~TRINITY_DN5340_c0_g1_i9.p3  ORF type:complete len:151 (+),score=26.78 TRINITY_DN5340_c0_g1_i9:236-688(+)